jgi:hypothetical protein
MAGMNPTAPPVGWYLRSMADRDTHRGRWSGVTRSVHSVCGLEFQPVALSYGGFFLPGNATESGSNLLAVLRCQRSGPVSVSLHFHY